MSDVKHTPGLMCWAEIVGKQQVLVNKARLHGGDWQSEYDAYLAMQGVRAKLEKDRAAIARSTAPAPADEGVK